MAKSTESRSWFRRLTLPVRITVIAVVILLVAVGIHWIYLELRTCGPGVDMVDGQCIGVTDGRVHLTHDLVGVLDKIRQENEEVDRSGLPSVSVAYLLPLPKSRNNAFAVSLRHELQGAYLAQRIANGTKTKAEEPLLRLLVANDGDSAEHWQGVTTALAEEVDGPRRLVAVIATGQTLAGRQEAIKELAVDHGIPVIASQLTGDHLTPPTTQSPVQGLVRLAPSSSDQVAAAVASLKREPGIARALLVQSTDPDDGYSKSLGDAFLTAFPDDMHTVLSPAEEYNPQLGGVASTMKRMLANICQQKPDVIFFAGHGQELVEFVKALPERPCDLRINIMTADSAASFTTTVAEDHDEQLRRSMEANMVVRYTTLAHPASWEVAKGSFKPGLSGLFRSSCEEVCFDAFFRGESLDDGSAIIGYDAITTATIAIRPGGTPNDTPDLIIQEFNRLHGPRAVAGASGWISLDNGNPINKAVPILEARPDGTVIFVQLSSPRRSPRQPDVPDLC